ncbi:Uma2 family endonuclease [Kitasatospora sp. NBC_01539]|uniref:Uma2 family endonuclease n=1 Tax=Kitasatospora sp. NBC_01539 TaxID=2903577 RepID=UPI00386026F8
MSTQSTAHSGTDHEAALKYAVQFVDHHRAQVIEGRIVVVSPLWGHDRVAARIRNQVDARAGELGCTTAPRGLDLPGSPNWYLPDLAVTPRSRPADATPTPERTLLIVEITCESTRHTDRVTKRDRYAEYGAPVYLLADRHSRECTVFSEPRGPAYTVVEGPHRFGTPVHLPDPFDLLLNTEDF